MQKSDYVFTIGRLFLLFTFLLNILYVNDVSFDCKMLFYQHFVFVLIYTTNPPPHPITKTLKQDYGFHNARRGIRAFMPVKRPVVG